MVDAGGMIDDDLAGAGGGSMSSVAARENWVREEAILRDSPCLLAIAEPGLILMVSGATVDVARGAEIVVLVRRKLPAPEAVGALYSSASADLDVGSLARETILVERLDSPSDNRFGFGCSGLAATLGSGTAVLVLDEDTG